MRPRPARFTRKARRPERELPVKNPWKLLALAIIKEAQRDLTDGNPYRAADARAFFAGTWYEQLADFVGIDPDFGRWKLLASGPVESEPLERMAVK